MTATSALPEIETESDDDQNSSPLKMPPRSDEDGLYEQSVRGSEGGQSKSISWYLKYKKKWPIVQSHMDTTESD